MNTFRVGYGSDIHRLEEGNTFILGGVSISHHKGTVGHSDGDALAHAISDALLGAANLRDIGTHFPDNDPAFKDADSLVLLSKVVELVRAKGYEIGNIDATINLQQPKLKPYIPSMIEKLAKTLSIAEEDLSLKAKTGEKIGFVGREEGVSIDAVCLIYKV
jgi:2-C-methyl-D-erythritol 2,4-cyclodiphosphate synthase